jgi:AcrR family transcriptional regulator
MVLERGIGEFGLRGVAKAVGTSDRMLLYYFGSKAALIEAVLDRISERLGEFLIADSRGGPLGAPELLAATWAILRASELTPFMRVWAEVNARGSRGEEPFHTFSARTVEVWRQWIAGRLAAPRGETSLACASALLAVVEGAVMQAMVQPDATDDAVRFLVRALARS